MARTNVVRRRNRSSKLPLFILLLGIVFGVFAFHLQKGGIYHSLACTLVGKGGGVLPIDFCPHTFVEGYTAPGFEPVRDTLLELKEQGVDLGSQVSVYVGGVEVVHLWGGHQDLHHTIPYKNNTLEVIFSSGKVVTALVVAMLVDRGLLDYDAPIAQYWPEFANCAEGSTCEKAEVTVSELMSHSSRMPLLDVPTPYSWQFLSDLDKIKKGIEGTKLTPLPVGKKKEQQRAYHAFTRGWIVQQLLRTVDPKKRTMTQFIQEEIIQPLHRGDVEYYIGAPTSVHSRISPLHDTPTTHIIKLVTTYLLHLVGLIPADPFFAYFMEASIDKSSLLYRTVNSFHPPLSPVTCSTPEYWSAPSPDAGAITNAHSLASIGAILAGKGTLNNTQFLSREGFKKATTEKGRISDELFGHLHHGAWTAAGWSKLNEGVYQVQGEDWWGWGGLGGSILAFNPKYNAAFAFVENAMLPIGIDLRVKKLTDVTLSCILKTQKTS